MKRIIVLCLCVATIFLFPGCHINSGEDGDTITVVDMSGTSVQVPVNVNRVVSTSDPCTDMLLALGQGDKLIGAYFRALDNPWFKEFLPNADKLIAFQSYEPEAESLIAIDTDVIFVPSPERADSLRAKGICALCIRFYTPDEVVAAVRLLGQIFGEKAKNQGDEWIEEFNAAKSYLANKLQDVSLSDRPVVYEILADKGRGPFRTYYGDNQAWLSYAGGILATKDFSDATSSTMPTEEAILATNPTIMFIGGTYATKEYADLLVNAKWADVEAVKNGNIFIEPTGAIAWNSCSATYTLLMYYCFSCMYPQKVDFDLKAMARTFYYKYYSVDLNAQQLDYMFSSKAPNGTELWA